MPTRPATQQRAQGPQCQGSRPPLPPPPTCSTISCLAAVVCVTRRPVMAAQAAEASSNDLTVVVRLKHRPLTGSQKMLRVAAGAPGGRRRGLACKWRGGGGGGCKRRAAAGRDKASRRQSPRQRHRQPLTDRGDRRRRRRRRHRRRRRRRGRRHAGEGAGRHLAHILLQRGAVLRLPAKHGIGAVVVIEPVDLLSGRLVAKVELVRHVLPRLRRGVRRAACGAMPGQVAATMGGETNGQCGAVQCGAVRVWAVHSRRPPHTHTWVDEHSPGCSSTTS
jgi:hypothetical protein